MNRGPHVQRPSGLVLSAGAAAAVPPAPPATPSTPPPDPAEALAEMRADYAEQERLLVEAVAEMTPEVVADLDLHIGRLLEQKRLPQAAAIASFAQFGLTTALLRRMEREQEAKP